MPGRWSDERDWRRREARDPRAEADWRDPPGERARVRGEERSFRAEGPVFGEDDYGVEYHKPPYETWSAQQGRSGPRFASHDYRRGGRYLGDDGRRPIYPGEYGMGGRGYAEAPPGYEGRGRFDARGGAERREPYERYAYEAGDFLRRTGEQLAGWFEGEEKRGARGLGPKGYRRSDERISEDVHHRLTEDSWLDATHIGVSVSDGEVTLSGTVAEREAKHRAERLIEDLGGVTHVQNNLRVDRGSYFTRAGRGYGDSVEEAQMAEGDASVTTSATAVGTTSRPSKSP